MDSRAASSTSDAEPWPRERASPAAISERDILRRQVRLEDMPVVRAFDVAQARDAPGDVTTGGREQRRLARVAAELHSQARASVPAR